MTPVEAAEAVDKGLKTKKEKKTAPRDSTRYKTGCDVLDVMVGGGLGLGYPSGRIINLVGDKSSSKTFLACELIAAAYHEYKGDLKWVYDDSESGFTFDTRHLYGFEIMPLATEDRVRSSTVEEAYCNVRKFFEGLKPGEKGIYVIDSLDGLTSEEMDARADERFSSFTKGKEFKKGSYQMGKAKYLSQEFFPQLAELIEETGGLLVVISQIRENIDPMSFQEYVRAGGKAMDFYCHTVIWLALLDKMKRKERVVGVTCKARLTKSKTPRPYRDCLYTLLFDYGLDNVGTSVDFLFNLRGKRGDLLGAANALDWDSIPASASPEDDEDDAPKADDGKRPRNPKELRAFIKEEGLEERYKGVMKGAEMWAWLISQPDLAPRIAEVFGVTRTREDLIKWIEENGLQAELKKRVVAKWEAIEEAIKTKRARKYS